MASTIVLARPTTESMITGTSGSRSRISRRVAMPSSPGIMTSRRIALGAAPPSSSARAARPLSAVST
jgi:hypothetical protein